MSLRTGQSYWRSLEQPLKLRKVADTEFEVAVLGAGITGALTAHRLSHAGLKTVLVDRGEVAAASTAASTGLLQYAIDLPLCELANKVGKANAVHAYRRGLWAVDDIERLVDQLGDACGFSRRHSLYLASWPWHFRRLRREYECRKENGFDVQLLSRRDLLSCSSIRAAGAIQSTGDGQIDPYRFTLRLIEDGIGAGLAVMAEEQVAQVDEREDCVLVKLADRTLRVRSIVYATGYTVAKHLRRQAGTLHSTYVVTSRPVASMHGWPDGCLLWETARPYFYARQTDDGRAMIGGADTSFSTDHRRNLLVARQTQRLVRRFHSLFPECELQPEFTWAGTFGETRDALAYIGQVKGRPRAYFAMGYGGNGITFGAIAAKLNTDLILGRPNRDAAVFGFDR